jgi:hypothetical protein
MRKWRFSVNLMSQLPTSVHLHNTKWDCDYYSSINAIHMTCSTGPGIKIKIILGGVTPSMQ